MGGKNTLQPITRYQKSFGLTFFSESKDVRWLTEHATALP